MEAAKGALNLANQAAQAVLSGSQWVAVNTANTALTAAQGVVNVAQQAASGTLDALNSALQTVGSALSRVKTSGFLQINSLGLTITARTNQQGFAFRYDLTVGGAAFRGEFAVNVFITGESLGLRGRATGRQTGV